MVGFVHEALVHHGDEDYRAGAEAFLRAAVDAGESAVALVDSSRHHLLGGLAGTGVRLVDAEKLARNPARLIPVLRELVDSADGPVRCLADPMPSPRHADAAAELALHDALLNLAFADTTGFALRCAVTAERAPTAERTHPVLVSADEARTSAAFSPGTAVDAFGATLTAPTEALAAVHFTLDDLPELRDLVTVRAGAFGLPRERALDLTLATNEIVTNSIVHGGDRGTLRLWHTETTFVCEVTDSGHIRNPLVGRVAPIPATLGGRGVWLANQLCDLVRIRSDAHTGTCVQLQIDR